MFEFTPTHLEQVLGTALSQGGHYADLYIEDTQVRSIELQDGKVSQAQQASLCGAGIRVLVDDQTGYAYTMDLTQQGLLNAARFAGNIALHGKLWYNIISLKKTDSARAGSGRRKNDRTTNFR